MIDAAVSPPKRDCGCFHTPTVAPSCSRRSPNSDGRIHRHPSSATRFRASESKFRNHPLPRHDALTRQDCFPVEATRERAIAGNRCDPVRWTTNRSNRRSRPTIVLRQAASVPPAPLGDSSLFEYFRTIGDPPPCRGAGLTNEPGQSHAHTFADPTGNHSDDWQPSQNASPSPSARTRTQREQKTNPTFAHARSGCRRTAERQRATTKHAPRRYDGAKAVGHWRDR